MPSASLGNQIRKGISAFGWAMYSLSRSQRKAEGYGTMPFMFDQTHVVNAVASWEVGRHWTLGAAYHFHTGRPYTPEFLDPSGVDEVSEDKRGITNRESTVELGQRPVAQPLFGPLAAELRAGLAHTSQNIGRGAPSAIPIRTGALPARATYVGG